MAFLSLYWLQHYKDLRDSNGIDGQIGGIDMDWVEKKHLRYGGYRKRYESDNNAEQFWVGPDGMVYYLNDLKKSGTSGSGGGTEDPANARPWQQYAAGGAQNNMPVINGYNAGYGGLNNGFNTDYSANSGSINYAQNNYAPRFNNPVANAGGVTNKSAVARPAATASAFAAGGGISGDVPQTAGNGKYSKQAIKSAALANPDVQQAIAQGRKVVLLRDNNVNGTRITNSQVLANASAGGQPFYLAFTGDLNADGSQAPGQAAGFSLPGSNAVPANPVNTATAAGGANNTSVAHDCSCHAEDDAMPKSEGKPACKPITTVNKVTSTEKATETLSRNTTCPPEDEGYFYVVNKEGNATDNAARQFFKILNTRAGNLFDHNSSTGLVKLKAGKKEKDVTALNTSDVQSKILAQTVYDATLGGVKFNGSVKKQIVKMRVLPKTDKENDEFIFDDFDAGYIDLEDFQNLLSASMPNETASFPLIQQAYNSAQRRNTTILQAAIIGHIVRERYSYNGYESHVSGNNKISDIEFEHTYHKAGIQRECQILIEMIKSVDPSFDGNFISREDELDPEHRLRIRYYPTKAAWKIISFYYSETEFKILSSLLFNKPS